MTSPSIKSLESLSPNSRTKAANPEAVALITSATSLESLFLAAAQAVAMDNPREGAALALKGMMYADVKAGLGQLLTLVAAAQAADAERSHAAAERDRAEAAACAARETREAVSEAAREERTREVHEEGMRLARIRTEQEEARLERLKKTGSEF